MKKGDRWIVIPNWQRFQHYGQARRPLWIKVYTELLHKDEYLDLPPGARALLHGIWLLYALNRGQVRSETVRGAVGLPRVHQSELDRLNRAGFIEFVASKPLYLSLEVGTELPTSPKGRGSGGRESAAAKRARAERWIENGAAAEIPLDRLQDVIADEFGIGDPKMVRELVARAQEFRG